MKKFNINGYQVEEITAPLYRAKNDRYIIVFWAEYVREKPYSKIKNVYDEKHNRNYTAWRFLKKYGNITNSAAKELHKHGLLYDYEKGGFAI